MPESQIESSWPAWVTSSLPWWIVIAAVCALAVVVLLAVLVRRTGAMERRLAALAALEDLKKSVERLTEGKDDLDLRRLEHVLIDIRDGQRRTEDLLLAAVEGRARAGESSVGAGSGASGPIELADRIVTRLLALGYERVLLVSPHEELARYVDGDGDVVIEARRDGAICKGRVQVRSGRITDIQIQPAYSAFP